MSPIASTVTGCISYFLVVVADIRICLIFVYPQVLALPHTCPVTECFYVAPKSIQSSVNINLHIVKL